MPAPAASTTASRMRRPPGHGGAAVVRCGAGMLPHVPVLAGLNVMLIAHRLAAY